VIPVEETELDSLGILGENGEFVSVAVPRRAERERLTGPTSMVSRTSTRFARKSATKLGIPSPEVQPFAASSASTISNSRGNVRRSASSSDTTDRARRLELRRRNVSTACGSGTSRLNEANVSNSCLRPRQRRFGDARIDVIREN